jgi:predicted permease
MRSLLQDLRYGLRLLGKAPGFTAAMIVTLTLGIGANTAIFSYVDATWLRPLPVSGADRLVRIFTSEHDATGDHPLGPSSYVDYLDLRTQATAFDGVITYEHRGGLLYGPDGAVRIPVDVVSPNYFTVLGVDAMLGRVFTERETERTGVVISDGLWRQRFGSDPEVVGKQVRLTRSDVTILGVMPRTFRGVDLQEAPAVWLPADVWAQLGGVAEFTARGNRRRDILARLRPGVSLTQAQSQVDAIGSRLAAEFPESNRDSRFTVVPEMKTRRDDARRQGLILLAIAFAVALIAAANVANLQMTRAEIRRRETATRIALGGGRWRLLRQWLAESVILAFGGTVFAIVLGRWIIDVLPTLFAASAQGDVGVYDFRLDPRALWFTIAIAGSTALLFGLTPALQAWKLDVATALRAGTTGGRERRGVRMRDVLVVTQVAMSLVLLMTAGLLVQTLEHLRAVDPGFNPRQNVLLLYVVPELTHRSTSQLHSYYETVQEDLERLPGVEQVALVQRVPFSPSLGGAEKEIRVPGVQPPAGRSGFRVNFDVVGPGYFSLMQTRLQRGRAFGPEDGPDAAKVVIVNDTMARRYWGGRGAVGQHLQIGNTDYAIVGVVEDTKWETLTEAARPLLYFPMTQQASDSLTILLRTQNDPATLVGTVRAELRRLDSGVPLLSATTLKQHMDYTLNDERVRARLTSAFAGLGLVLAATGLYGVLAFIVTRRTHEIGIRVALGAESSDVLRLMLDYGLRRVLVGAAIGVLLALTFRQAISGLLFGVGPADPATLAVVLIALIGVAIIAAWVPVRRATQVDPIIALRVE